MSDATVGAGTPDPDDRAVFDALTAHDPQLSTLAGLGDEESDQSEMGPNPEPAPTQHQQAAPSPEHQPKPAPATTAPPPPAPAPKPPTKPNFPLRNLEPVGLAMTVAMAATGQIMYWRQVFGGTVAATVAAIAIAAAFEVIMIGATDAGLDLKAESGGTRGWFALFLSGAAAAGVAAAVQLLHWPTNMGVPFAAASFIGWAVHAIRGWIKAQRYVEAREAYDAEVQRLSRKTEARNDAAYERQLAEHETSRQATTRAVAEAEQTPTTPAAKPRKKTKPAGRQSVQLTRDVAVRELGDEFWQLGPAEINQRAQALGYLPVNTATIRRWRKQA